MALAAAGRAPRIRAAGLPFLFLRVRGAGPRTRPGNRANPRPATPAEIEALLRSVF
jgi:hypothetical protein